MVEYICFSGMGTGEGVLPPPLFCKHLEKAYFFSTDDKN